MAVVLLTFILYTHTHKLSHVEDWGREHQHPLALSTGWQIGDKDLTDDRLGRLLEVLGEDEERSAAYQQQQSQHLIRAYALPTEVVRYDTTSFNVHHAPTEARATAGLLVFGHSKDRRPDLPLFLRIPARIKGLLLLVALQALALLDFVAQRALAQRAETLAGLVPGDPRMSTARPSAERLLVAFDHLHLLITTSTTQCQGHLDGHIPHVVVI